MAVSKSVWLANQKKRLADLDNAYANHVAYAKKVGRGAMSKDRYKLALERNIAQADEQYQQRITPRLERHDEVSDQEWAAKKKAEEQKQKQNEQQRQDNVGKTTAQVVPGKADPDDPNQINIVDYAGQVTTDPTKFFRKDDPATTGTNESASLSDRNQAANPNATGTNVDKSNYQKPNQTGVTATTATAGQATTAQGTAAQVDPRTGQAGPAAQANTTDPRQAATVDVATTQEAVANEDMEAAQGELSEGAQVDAEGLEIDVEAHANGETGLGKALNDSAQLDLDDVDKRATVQGQLEELQAQFVDDEGNPKIPAWAQGTARNVSKIAAFSGMTGTAATAAMAQAIMEASLPIAQQDAQFFQTVTLENLSNKQQSIINKANVLANLEITNADARLTAAIQNSQNFLQMDLANLSNEQQARVINNQNRVQSILEDAKAKNTARLFEAEQQNEMDKFYDSLNSSIEQFNVTQTNTMAQFNANKRQEAQMANAQLRQDMEKLNVTEANRQSQINAELRTQVNLQNMEQVNTMKKFNREVETAREQFYKTMQYNIDLANAKWRQEITMNEDEQQFEAAATDVKNMVGVSLEQLNQLWDRSDSMLDYLWKSTENEAERKQRLVELKLEGSINNKAADKAGVGSIFGTLAGAAAESFFSDFDWGW